MDGMLHCANKSQFQSGLAGGVMPGGFFVFGQRIRMKLKSH